MDDLLPVGMKLYGPIEYPRYCPLFCFIKCFNGMICTVDPEDWIRLHNFTWYAKETRGGWYAYRKTGTGNKTRHIYMSREIAHAPKGVHVHHRNGLTLFNVKENLEHIDPAAHAQLTKWRRIQRRA